MRAHDQAQPPPPPPLPPAPPQQPVGQPQEQLPPVMCVVCFNDIQPHEAVIVCNVCSKRIHRGELITYLTIASANGRPQNCPACRADMRWVLANQQLGAAPVVAPVVGPVAGPVAGPVVGPVAGPVMVPLVGPAIIFPNTPPSVEAAELLGNFDNYNPLIGLE